MENSGVLQAFASALVLVLPLALIQGIFSSERGMLRRLGNIGKAEIAQSYRQCYRVLLAAGGAGLITAGTVLLKLWILHQGFSSFGQVFLVALNFAASFGIMQVFGFKLATKQSPLLGAALGKRWTRLSLELARQRFLVLRWRAGLLGYVRMNEKWQLRMLRTAALTRRWKEEVAWALRTQAASAAGNFLFVVSAMAVLDALIWLCFGAHFVTPEAARSMLAEFHPFKTGLVAYASFTGFLLWFCMALAGWIAHRFSTLSKDSVTSCFNVLLGAALALTPILGKTSGLPLDVRHFTLSSGTIAVATFSLGLKQALGAGLGMALLGVLVIGVMNFSVSFALGFLASLASARGGGPSQGNEAGLRGKWRAPSEQQLAGS